MTHEEEPEPTEPTVTPVPEPDQDEEEEAHEHEAEEGTEPSAVPEVEAQAPRDDRELEKAFKAIGKENTRHADRISQIMAEDAQALIPCELCSHFVAGFRLPVAPPPEIVGRVRAAIGLAERENFRQSPFHIRCDTCGGLGEVLTDSLVTNQETVPCPTCGARGFVQNPDAPVPSYTVTLEPGVIPLANGGNETNTAQGIDPREAARRMQQAIAQAQGHAVGPTAEA